MARWIPIALAGLLTAGCSNLLSVDSKTTPTPVDATKLSAGQWASITSTTTLTDTCTNFKWTIVEVNGTSGTGTFTATCLTNMAVSGTANGTLTPTGVTWTAEAIGTRPGGAACPISLSGTATYDGTQFRIPYTGTTCLGPVSGAEVLRRN